MEKVQVFETPLGWMRAEEAEGALRVLAFCEGPGVEAESALLHKLRRQLDEYFAQKRQNFTVPLAPAGTAFQQEVWAALCKIPYGETRSYKQLAQALGRPGACRAVGGANAANPIALLIPCHRVVRQGGALGGYAFGEERKAKLLALESGWPEMQT